MAKEKQHFLTKRGKTKIKKELDYLVTIKRSEVIKAIKEARSLGDLGENAEYHSAREDQSQIEAKISELESVLENCKIIKETKKDSIDVGSKVMIEYVEDGSDEEYQIVGSNEADPFENKISNESPIAKAIIGHKKGEVVEVESPKGSYKLKIVKIA